MSEKIVKPEKKQVSLPESGDESHHYDDKNLTYRKVSAQVKRLNETCEQRLGDYDKEESNPVQSRITNEFSNPDKSNGTDDQVRNSLKQGIG